MQKIVVTSAVIAAVALASVAAQAQSLNSPSAAGWGPVAAQAAQVLSGGAVYAPGYVATSGYGAYAYEPGPTVAPGLGAFAYEPGVGDVVTASWFTRGFGAYAYAPRALAVGNYGLGMAAGAYCARRYRSYDAGTGTFLGYDGQRHPCP
jgi:hypothetical protein